MSLFLVHFIVPFVGDNKEKIVCMTATQLNSTFGTDKVHFYFEKKIIIISKSKSFSAEIMKEKSF